MSSTTDATNGRGQVLVIFALSLTALILFAALAFDTGLMLVQRRDQQNAADAAALAGSFFLPDDPNAAEAAAFDIAEMNGYATVNGGTVLVEVTTPYAPRGGAGAIEVKISDNRPSIFGGILGIAGWDVGARAVAVNQSGVGAGFAMLALEDHDCDAVLVSGNATVTVNGNIQVNSDCTNGALKRSGGGTVTVTADGAACNVHGDIKDVGSGTLDCVQNEGTEPIPDPLEGLAPPAKPEYPADIVAVDALADNGQTLDVPNGCPGAVDPDVESTQADPITCQFTSSYAGTVWRLHQGYYPGGIHLQAGTFYWEPGIYWIGGGGVTINGNGTTSVSVASGGSSLTYGVLIYNTENPAFHDECAASAATNPLVQCIQPIDLAGSNAGVDFYPINYGPYKGLVIFQDPTLDIPGDDVILNGASSETQVRGTIYVKLGDVKVNGNGGVLTTDQIIANTYKINGNGPGGTQSSVWVKYDTDFLFKFTGAGLVE